MSDVQKIERLRKALERLLAFIEWGMSLTEKRAAAQEAREALEETKP
jgi:hypothetical protein